MTIEWALIVAHESDNYHLSPAVTLCPTYAAAMEIVRSDFAEEIERWRQDLDPHGEEPDTPLDDDTVLDRLASYGVRVWIEQPYRVG